MRDPNHFLVAAIRILSSVAAVVLITFLDRVLNVNSSTAAFSFLLLILGLATKAGFRESIAASFAGMFAYNFFFLPPVGTLTIADPQNWVALFVFLATAITASKLSASARRKTLEAASRQQELQRMYDFSRALMLGDDELSLRGQITAKIYELFRFPDVWFYSRLTESVNKVASGDSPLRESLLREVAVTGTPWQDAQHSALIVPVQLGGHILGSLGVSGGAAVSEVTLKSIAQLAAIAIEKTRAQELASRMEATRQNEQLKSTLLDALAHEFKTPLTSIKAATTTVLAKPKLDPAEQELLTVVDEEADRLTNLVSDTIELARWDGGAVKLQPESCSVADIVFAVTEPMRGRGREFEVSLDAHTPSVYVDRRLTELALRQLLNNAVVYSFPASHIYISAEPQEAGALIRVLNTGPVIPKSEQESIFDKFYRGQGVRSRVAGTGMGLSIARDIIEAHGGRIWVDSDLESGTRFSFTLPVSQPPPSSVGREKQTVA